MPTTSLPGIGASIRIERAARAIARSSARASMRETLMWCSGRTSYWVTTGPELTFTTFAGIAKLSSFSSIRREFDSWSSVPPTSATGRGSSRSMAGRVQSIAFRDSRAVGASPARAVAARAGRADSEPLPPSEGPVHTVWLIGDWPDRGAGSSRMLRAGSSRTAAAMGMATGSLVGAFALAVPFVGAALASVGRASWARRRESAVVEPTQRAVPVNGETSWRSCRLNASMSPSSPIAVSSTIAPGAVSRGSSVPPRNRPIRPPPRSSPRMSRARISKTPSAAMYAMASPPRVIPHPEPAFLPGPAAIHQPPARSRNGSSQRPASNHGAMESRHQSVRAPSPGRTRAMSVIAPRAIITVPRIERTTSGLTPAEEVVRLASSRRPRGARLRGSRGAGPSSCRQD